jgi:hypothetical protein
MRKRVIAVIGAGTCDADLVARAREVGRLLGEAGCVVVTGGLGGVMEAASQGAREAGALVIGILPDASSATANAYVDVAIATGMGDARNVVLVNTADAFVAVGGALGTLSEIALALKRGKPVVSLGSWTIDPRVQVAGEAVEAVRWVIARCQAAASATAP